MSKRMIPEKNAQLLGSSSSPSFFKFQFSNCQSVMIEGQACEILLAKTPVWRQQSLLFLKAKFYLFIYLFWG